MHDLAPRLGRFPSGTQAKAGNVFSVVVSPGEHLVQSVRKRSLPLKRGDRINTLFYLGEGSWQGKLGGKKIKYEDGDLKLKQIRPTVYKVWT